MNPDQTSPMVKVRVRIWSFHLCFQMNSIATTKLERGAWGWDHKKKKITLSIVTGKGFGVWLLACEIKWKQTDQNPVWEGVVFTTGTPLQYSCLENPINIGALWAAVHGVAKSRTRLSDFTFIFPFHALEKEMAAYSSVLAWRIPGTGEPGGLSSVGSHRVGHDWSDLAAAAFTKRYKPRLKTPSIVKLENNFWHPKLTLAESRLYKLCYPQEALGEFVVPTTNVAKEDSIQQRATENSRHGTWAFLLGSRIRV